MTYRFIGGPVDGQMHAVPQGTITWNEGGHQYIAIEFGDRGQPRQTFFMATGMLIKDAVTKLKCLTPKSTKS